jgi:hypothetical protein
LEEASEKSIGHQLVWERVLEHIQNGEIITFDQRHRNLCSLVEYWKPPKRGVAFTEKERDYNYSTQKPRVVNRIFSRKSQLS